MECIRTKRVRRRNKRQRRMIKRCDQARFEVKVSKRHSLQKMVNINTKNEKNNESAHNMEAITFWENYNAAYEWQKRFLFKFLNNFQFLKNI